MSELHGVIVIDKPQGMTSADVVHRVKQALGLDRVGHTGTLDPMATGVLPLCLGQATKIAGYLLAEDKAYEGELELGTETDTLDAQGKVVRTDLEAARAVTRERLCQAMAGHIGPGEQVPPMFSALKHKGKRLHELARAGQTVARDARPIVIHALELMGFEPPRARFHVHCSKGTYVRSLVADIGRELGCGAHLTALRRVRSGAFALDQAMELADITVENSRRRLISPAFALAHLPALTLPEALVEAVANGQHLTWTMMTRTAGSEPAAQGRDVPPRPEPGSLVRLLLPGGELLALARIHDDERLRYERVFTYGLTKPPVSSNLPHPRGF